MLFVIRTTRMGSIANSTSRPTLSLCYRTVSITNVKPKSTMLAISAGGDHCAYVFGMLTQLFVQEPANSNWKYLTGNSAGAFICAAICQTNINSPQEYISAISDLYKEMETPMTHKWSNLGSFMNTIEALLFHNSLYQDSLPKAVRTRLSERKMAASGRHLSVGVYNKTKGQYEVISGVHNMLQPICASASVPLVFPPVQMNGDTYVDGGLGHILPVPQIIKWCDANSGDIDILCCYPFNSIEEFAKTEIQDSRYKLISMGQDMLIDMYWNNYQRDLNDLATYFNIRDIREHPVNKWVTAERTVRLFSPAKGIYSDFTNCHKIALHQMFEHGKQVVHDYI